MDYVSPLERRLIVAVNAYRARYGLWDLAADPILTVVAREGAQVGSHVYRGRWAHERARARGFSGPVTDNVAIGYPTPESAVGDDFSGWGSRQGVGHNLQMLGQQKINGCWIDQRFNRIGAGVIGDRYCAVFGRLPEIPRPTAGPAKTSTGKVWKFVWELW